MPGKPFKKDKLQERFLNEINAFIRAGVSDQRLRHISVTKVEISSDMKFAKAYWDTYDPAFREEAKTAVKNLQGKVRTHLAGIIKMRQIPRVEFIYDAQYESEKAITEILNAEAKLGKNF